MKGFIVLATPVIPSTGSTTGLNTGPKKLRGFAALKARGELARLSAISRIGAAKARDLGTAHRWNADEARAARARRGTNSQPLQGERSVA